MKKTILLNKLFYSIKNINIAIKDFGHLAKFQINENDDYFTISIDSTHNTDLISDEFCNYMLGLSLTE